MKGVDTYQGRGLIADPIHQYILYTRPDGDARRVHRAGPDRLPVDAAAAAGAAAAVGAVGVPGRGAQPLPALPGGDAPRGALRAAAPPPRSRPSSPTRPSAPLFEELMRVAGLLHDVGHGPFGHFFDDNFLADFDLTHEKVGQRIIREELGDLIRGLRRSPSGPLRGRGAHRPRVDLLPDGQELYRAHRRAPALARAPEAAALRHLHRRQHGLRAARLLHVRGRGGADRHRADHVLLLLQREGAHARPRRDPGVHHVPERPVLPLHQRLLSPDHAGHRPPPEGDLPRHHEAGLSLRPQQGAPARTST